MKSSESKGVVMAFGRAYDILRPVTEDLHHLAPVPIIYHELSIPDIDSFHLDLVRASLDSR